MKIHLNATKLFDRVAIPLGLGLLVTGLIVKSEGLLWFGLGWLVVVGLVYAVLLWDTLRDL